MSRLSTIFDALERHQQRGVLRIIDDGTGKAVEPLNNFFASTDKNVAWFLAPDSLQSANLNRQNEWRLKKYRQYLGEEYDVVVMDLTQGFNLEALAALSGTITLGGLLILITFSDEKWCTFADPEAQRIASYPHTIESLPNNFVEYFLSVIDQSEGVLSLSESLLKEQGHCLDNTNIVERFVSNLTTTKAVKNTPISNQNSLYITQDQAMAASEIIPRLMNNQPVIISITADRGRGKSSLLGLTLRQITKVTEKYKANKKIAIVSASNDSLTVLKHHLYKDNVEEAKLMFDFVSADQLLLHPIDLDLIVIDEAASYPLSVIKRLAQKTEKLVLATTVHGYEGTGRGYFYKLQPWLESHSKANHCEFYATTLSQPIRWNPGDHIEQFINKALKLDVELPTIAQPELLDSKDLRLQAISSEQLVNGEVLDSIFSMLVHAHYQTSPNDLRAIFDAPDQELFVVYAENQVVATVWLSYEGVFEQELIGAIAQGRRRPRGHLSSQSLIAHCGYTPAGELRFARVTRIAVHPDLQSIGIGSSALKLLTEHLVTHQKADLLLTSFGLSPALLQFWRNNGFVPVRLGLKPETSTGEYSVLMISDQIVNDQTKSELKLLVHYWQRRFCQTYLAEKALAIRGLHFDADQLDTWVEEMCTRWFKLNTEHFEQWSIEQHYFDLKVFASGFRSADSCVLAHRWALQIVNDQSGLSLLTDKFQHGLVNPALIQRYKLSGEKELIQSLRRDTKDLLTRLSPVD